MGSWPKFISQVRPTVWQQSVEGVVLVPQNSLEQIVVHVLDEFRCCQDVWMTQYRAHTRNPGGWLPPQSRCRSVAVVKPHQALAANISLATTTLWKTVCIASSDMPWVRGTLIAWTDCAYELTMFCTWALTDSLYDMITRRTFNVVTHWKFFVLSYHINCLLVLTYRTSLARMTRVIPGCSDGGVNCCCRLVVKTISTDLLPLSVRLLAVCRPCFHVIQTYANKSFPRAVKMSPGTLSNILVTMQWITFSLVTRHEGCEPSIIHFVAL